MWERINYELPIEVASITTGVYALGDFCLAVVMRPYMFGPPYLGMQFSSLPKWLLRQRNTHMQALHILLQEPLFYAEAETERPGSEKFITFLGFTKSEQAPNLFERSI